MIIITVITIIVLLVTSIRLRINAKNQKEIDRLEMVDFEIRFEKLEEKLNKLLKKINRNED